MLCCTDGFCYSICHFHHSNETPSSSQPAQFRRSSRFKGKVHLVDVVARANLCPWKFSLCFSAICPSFLSQRTSTPNSVFLRLSNNEWMDEWMEEQRRRRRRNDEISQFTCIHTLRCSKKKSLNKWSKKLSCLQPTDAIRICNSMGLVHCEINHKICTHIDSIHRGKETAARSQAVSIDEIRN